MIPGHHIHFYLPIKSETHAPTGQALVAAREGPVGPTSELTFNASLTSPGARNNRQVLM
jgi:hypothetical protein